MSFLYSIGLMSGTSIDAIDGTIIKTNGITSENLGINISIEYPKETKELLISAIKNPILFLKDTYLLNKIIKDITLNHKKLIDKIILRSNISPDIIGFHGQTIYHNANKKISIQLGDAPLLSNLLKIKVISNFRDNDIKNGGQGAPIAPIYHKSLIIKHKFELPCCFLNIGGVANISFWDGKELIGFDTGPGNGLIDAYTQARLGLNFDKDGSFAYAGNTNMSLVTSIMKNKFFYNSGPKSLDKFSFSSILNIPEFVSLETNDAISTLTEITIISIIKAIFLLPSMPKRIIIVGGGKNNLYILNNLKNRLNCKVQTAEEIKLNGQFIEAELIAYLAARRIKKLPITFPSTTGIPNPLIGGKINNFKKFLN